MNLTFKGFLKGYCRELTGLETNSLRRLIRSAETDSPSAAEAVYLLALAQDKGDYALELARETWMADSYAKANELHQTSNSWDEFFKLEDLPHRYLNVWRSYLAVKSRAATNRRVSGLMREKTLAALEQSGTTCYSLCKQLGLNKGNVYAYLHGGDNSKVSRETARSIMEYALSLAAPL